MHVSSRDVHPFSIYLSFILSALPRTLPTALAALEELDKLEAAAAPPMPAPAAGGKPSPLDKKAAKKATKEQEKAEASPRRPAPRQHARRPWRRSRLWTRT